MTISELKILLIFKAMEVYLTLASWIFIAIAFVITAVAAKIERLNKWSQTCPGMLSLTAFGCAIAATMVIVFVLGLADLACQNSTMVVAR